MAYVHCHSCNWSQDDFWTWKWKAYNPISYFLRQSIPTWGRPHFVKCDPLLHPSGRIFSWHQLWREFLHMSRSFFRQKWWTNAAWKKAIKENGGKWPKCPSCGHNRLCID